MADRPTLSGVVLLGRLDGPADREVFCAGALAFVAALERALGERRHGLLRLRALRQERISAGEMPDFLPHTASVRAGHWTGPSIPADLLDRRVEITGPVDRKMVINALNSGAKVYMADFEDSTAPTFRNLADGQANLREAVRRTLAFTDAASGKQYRLAAESKLATLMVRPRGWHLDEAHLEVDGRPVSASLFDFGIFFWHNAHALISRGSGPYFYLPKMESHLEARLWNDVFVFAQNYCGVPRGTIRATVLIETILAAFEMDEILFELREHSAGLNCGRWDYIFSFVKKFRSRADLVLPDRADVTMTRPFMQAYVRLLVATCHRRRVHAMGGMAAQIPIKGDEARNRAAFDKVRADKEREAMAGHDGTWVAHPGLIPVAMEVFDRLMPAKNQIGGSGPAPVTVTVTAADLLEVGPGRDNITEAGLRSNLSVGLEYIEAWLRGVGCVPINNLMEDAATAEISRVQLWQWIRHGAMMRGAGGGRPTPVTKEVVLRALDEEVARVRERSGDAAFRAGKWDLAARLYRDMLSADDLSEFLTLAAYPHICAREARSRV